MLLSRICHRHMMRISVGGCLLVMVIVFKHYVAVLSLNIKRHAAVDEMTQEAKNDAVMNSKLTHTGIQTNKLPVNSSISAKATNHTSANHVEMKDRLLNATIEQEYYTLKSQKINPQDFKFLIENKYICNEYAPLFLLVLVPSIHEQTDARNAIRNTWGSYNKNGSMKLLFLFGTNNNHKFDSLVKEENDRYGDIVQADFVDSYKNLTYKILMGLRWVALYCGDVDYVLKADMDVFVKVPALVDQLKKHPPAMKGTIYGHIYPHSNVRRTGKWAVSKKDFPMAQYPKYAAGNSYVISGNLAPRLYMTSQFMPYIPIEDVFITGCLVRVLDIQHRSIDGFTFWLDKAPNPCQFARKRKITATKVTIPLMYSLWKTLNGYPNTCKRA